MFDKKFKRQTLFNPIQLHSLNIFMHQLQANNNMTCVIFLKTMILFMNKLLNYVKKKFLKFSQVHIICFQLRLIHNS